MKIKLKQSCGVMGAHVEVGTSIEVPDNVAHSLIAMGKAEKHSAEEPKKKKGKA